MNLGTLGEAYPNLTHLHLWRLHGLKRLDGLPDTLQCLDARYCPPTCKKRWAICLRTLETLVLEGARLGRRPISNLPAGEAPIWGKTRRPDLRDCERIPEVWIRRFLGRRRHCSSTCPDADRFAAPLEAENSGWPSALEDIRLNQCESANFSRQHGRKICNGWNSAAPAKITGLRPFRQSGLPRLAHRKPPISSAI
ncbi:MAG: hypothetical protein H7A53_05775 [Akkermansiaceae bacterium]|nr:hypothetical protein [Akkermansiaceae bacterium]